MVAIAIVGILLAITAPAAAPIVRAYGSRAAVREIIGHLQKARMAAITENNRYRLSLVTTTQIQVHDDGNGDGVVNGTDIARTYDIAANHPGTTLAFSSAIVFNASGHAPSAGNVTVSFPGVSAQVVRVTSAGRVRGP